MPRTDLVLALLLASLTALSRVPFRARLLPTWDAVQFALALSEYDVLRHQPHPPGYILYVAAARLLQVVFGDATQAYTWLSILASGATVFLGYRLAWRLDGRETAVIAAIALGASPLFWFNGVIPLPYAVEAALATTVAGLAWSMRGGHTRSVLWSALALGVAGGVRQSLLALLFPLWLGMAWAGLRRWRPVLAGCALIALTSALWLVPMVWLTGGLDRYVWAARELFESTVRRTTLIGPPDGWRDNVRGLLAAGVMSFGLLSPALGWLVLRGVGHVARWQAREWFLAAWIVPPLLVYTGVHFGQYGYLLTVLPAFYIVIARWLAAWAGRRPRVAGTLLASLVAAHAAYFAGARAVHVPEPSAGAGAIERPLAAWGAFYRHRLWPNTAEGLREQEGVIAAYVDAIRREFDPTDTVVVTELGNPRSYPWFRHATYYLPEFPVYHLRLGDFSPGYLTSRRLVTMAALAGPEIPLPATAARLVWMVDDWNPTLPRPPGLQERVLPRGRRLYVLDVDRRPVAHGGYRLAPTPALARVARHPGGVDADCPTPSPRVNAVTFHGDPRRLGWNAAEAELTPARLAGPAFGALWSSPPLDAVTLDGWSYTPHLYATPLYVDGVEIAAGPHAGRRLGVVFAASSNAWAYAINAFPSACGGATIAPGTILWRARLGTPAVVPGLDGGVPLGVLSTPTIDLGADPPRIYVAALDGGAGWQVFALELGSGRILPGWPLAINDTTLAPINANGPARFGAAATMSQRGALNLSPRGDVLYVAFGGAGPGWMVAVDTHRPGLSGAFASAPGGGGSANGGMWSAGGPAIDDQGRVYMTTGNSHGDSGETPGIWGSSLMQWSPPLRLRATYTPFNYCVLDRRNMDLVGPIVLPDLDRTVTSTPRLVAFGGKQGTVYLVDRERLPGGTEQRPPCGRDASKDRSLLPARPQFGGRGPLNVFGPYTDEHAQFDQARMRTTPAYYRDASGASYLFVSGSSKATPASATSVPPGLARLRVMTAPGSPASLAVDRWETETTLLNPGSPVVTSHGPNDAVVWVLDPNQPRLAPLIGPAVTRPVLYAFDATTLKRLWRSAPGDLEIGGKYSSPAIARGVVFVGTDRVQAFGVRGVRGPWRGGPRGSGHSALNPAPGEGLVDLVGQGDGRGGAGLDPVRPSPYSRD